MTTKSHRAAPVRRCVGGLLATLLAMLSAVGCVTATYRATELPLEYVAKPVDRLNKADLSRLTSCSVRSNQIGIGDFLEIQIFSGYGANKLDPVKVNVGPDGTAEVPLIGPVAVSGLTPDEASRAIEAAGRQREIFRTPNVSVKIDQQKMNKIAVSGAVMQQGVIEIPQGNSTLLNAILAAGGLTEYASATVTIRRPALSANMPDALRGNPLRLAGGGNSVVLASYDEPQGEEAETIEINLSEATKEGKGVFYLDDGDVVHVQKQPERKIQVSGLVKNPGDFELPPDEDLYLINALGLAGGASTTFADSVIVIRRVPGSDQPITIKASVREALMNRGNIRIQENDVVMIEETPVTMAFETLKTFFRFSVGSSLALF